MQLSQPICLVVDGGGTKTHAVASTMGVYGEGWAAASNPQDVGLERAFEEIRQAVTQALNSLSKKLVEPIVISQLKRAWVAVAGLDSSGEINALRNVLKPYFQLPEDCLIVQNDALLLAAPFLSSSQISECVLVVAGTGSMAMSVRCKGTDIEITGRRGGLGFLFGDEGSAFHIGREAVRRLAYRRDVGDVSESPLELGLLKHYKARDVDEILQKAYCLDPCQTSIGESETKRKQAVAEGTRVVLATLSDPLSMACLRTCVGALAGDVAELVQLHGLNKMSLGGALFHLEAYRSVFLDQLASRGVSPLYVTVIAQPATAGVNALLAQNIV